MYGTAFINTALTVSMVSLISFASVLFLNNLIVYDFLLPFTNIEQLIKDLTTKGRL
ncbi:hypothetical protein J2S74_001602 [Evansella vedderi]|uniref:Uncharacterized protein n=1 Tax=Evansella vedderi TaxID=38282 RepID=A0ABT9ZSM5_9BACI|nr:hypothetical protein [Evansella vedderi]MDQ0254227.1 hypothetical protein [Evansella vedderi]